MTYPDTTPNTLVKAITCVMVFADIPSELIEETFRWGKYHAMAQSATVTASTSGPLRVMPGQSESRKRGDFSGLSFDNKEFSGTDNWVKLEKKVQRNEV